jgi:hypothetical protein
MFRRIFGPKYRGHNRIRDEVTQSGVSRVVPLIKYY